MIKPSEKIAIISGEREISFSGMLRYITLFASQSPKQKGDKTLIFSENREGWLFALYAVWKNLGIVVPVDASSTVDDVAYIISDCNPKAAWVSEHKRPILEEAMKRVGNEMEILSIDDYENRTLRNEQEAEIVYDAKDTCLICYTSGTTGLPKGVMLSFENMMANVRAVWKDVPVYDESRRTLILLPLHHVLDRKSTRLNSSH